MRPRTHTIFAILLLVSSLGGCSRPRKVEQVSVAQLRQEAYDTSEAGFAHAELIFATPDASRPEIAQALILVRKRKAAEKKDDPDTRASDDASQEVEFYEDEISILGKVYKRRVYWWTFSDSRRTEGTSHAISVVLDAEGYPAIVERLDRDSALRRVFVSKKLEEAAQKIHEAPLDGRRLVVEGSVDEFPNLVVPGSFAHSPLGLGNFVYIDEEDAALVASLCRCEPPRIGDITSSSSYALRESDEERFLSSKRWDPAPGGEEIAEGLRLPPEL